MKFDPAQLPIIQMSLSSELDELEFQGLIVDLNEALERIEGVASVDAEGLTTDTIEIQLDSDELENYQLDMNMLQQ